EIGSLIPRVQLDRHAGVGQCLIVILLVIPGRTSARICFVAHGVDANSCGEICDRSSMVTLRVKFPAAPDECVDVIWRQLNCLVELPYRPVEVALFHEDFTAPIER